jgi:hypothetical protein
MGGQIGAKALLVIAVLVLMAVTIGWLSWQINLLS